MTTNRLQRLAQACSPELCVQTDNLGVSVELVQQRLRFHHSFLAGAIRRRASQPGQSLLKACNNRQRTIHTVLDLTAGWGADAYLLARHGQQVTLLERNELIYSIVAYSLQQLADDPDNGDLASRLEIIHADALHYLKSADQPHYDCIYLDPMFAAHKSGAKPAKEMQILQALTDNREIESSFELALQRAGKRVVVKRAAKAPSLTPLKPDLVHRSKTIRFDIYLTA